jgi:hypothetical protein
MAHVPVAQERRDDVAARMVRIWERGFAVQTWNANATPTGVGAGWQDRNGEAREVFGRPV